MTDLTLSDRDRADIREMLLAMRARGVATPILPTEVDLNGDGMVDGYGLDGADNVVPVYACPIEDTAYEATGEGGA